MSGPRATIARHASLAKELLSEIGSGAYAVGDRFPTEQDLQQRFQVGRHTVREALKLLTEQGLLGRRRKTGTIVLALRPVSTYVHTLRDLGGLLDFAQATQLVVSHLGYITEPRELRDDPSGASARRWLRAAGPRMRRPSGDPLCWAEILVPEPFAPSREAVRSGGRAIYEMVLAEHSLVLGHVEQTISAGELPPALAATLGAAARSPALVVRRRYVTDKGHLFEISQNTYPADRYSVHSIIRKRT